MLNKAILMGRLTRNPELRYTPSNMPVVSFTLAVDRRGRKDAAGNKQTDFIDCVAWDRNAEFMQQWFTKGMLAIVVGRIQTRNWEDKNGSKRVSVEVVCEDVQFGETKRAREENAANFSNFAESSGAHRDSYSAPQQGGGSRPPAAPAASAAPEFGGLPDSEDFSEIDGDEDVPF